MGRIAVQSLEEKDMSKAQKQVGEAREQTQLATDQAAQQSALYQQIAQQLQGQQQGVIGQYAPMLQQLFQQLQGQQLPEGLSAGAKSALTSQALQGIPGQFQNAQSKLMANMTARGFGGQGGSANLAGQMGGLYGQRELAKSNALSNITLQDEAARNQNIQSNREFGSQLYGQGAGTMGQLAGLYNPASYFGMSSNSTGQQMQGAGQLGTQVQKGFWDQFGGALMGAGLGVGSSWLSKPKA
jgi:hypothetical protein